MRRVCAVIAIVGVAAASVARAAAAGALSDQGYTSQGHQITFKKTKAGVARMAIAVRASCFDSQGVNQGDYDFALAATDAKADRVRHGRFMTILPGNGAVPTATIKGRFNARGVARGTINASGPAKGPKGEDLGTCKSPTVRWTAGP